MGKHAKPSGAEQFDTYYRGVFGQRWDALRAALGKERSPIAFTDGLTTPYFLDEASLWAARLLPVHEGDQVLDMCAAPGGKTLVIASQLRGTGRLVSNDRSADRRNRLLSVIKDHLPAPWQNAVTVTGYDAAQWGIHQQEAFDAILLDAPCSSERHVLTSPSALSQWSPSRPKRLAIGQFAMLCSALEAVKVGGVILYSTCAITPEEDEMVIQKLSERRKGRFSLLPTRLPQGEARSFGSIILPDTAEGRGPMYVCMIRRES
jgi:16S rRNA C967 or C1407 C5-methylase (RsmB/RsmF family)